MIENEKIREYLRILSSNEKLNLNTLYKIRLNARRNGFLTLDHVKRLSGKQRWDRDTSNDDISKYFSEIREKAYSAFLDFQIMCSVLTENQLEEIFTKTGNDTYPFTDVLSTLLPTMLPLDILNESIKTTKGAIESAKIDLASINNKDRINELNNWLSINIPRSKQTISELEKQIEKLPEQEWRKFILEDLVIQCLTWYLKSGIFKTDSHRRLLDDVIDAITVMSSGKKRFSRYDESFYGSTNTF